MLWENGSRLPAFMNEPCSWQPASCVHMLWKWGIKWKLRGNRRFFILLFCGRFDFGFCKKNYKKKTPPKAGLFLRVGLIVWRNLILGNRECHINYAGGIFYDLKQKNWNAFKEMLFKNILCTMHSMCTNTGT